MTDRIYIATTTRDAARELAAVCAQIRAAYPGTHWKTPAVADTARRPPDPLPRIIDLYRAGCEYTTIGKALSLSRSAVSNRIRDARADGTWPDELRRRP